VRFLYCCQLTCNFLNGYVFQLRIHWTEVPVCLVRSVNTLAIFESCQVIPVYMTSVLN
jgi:hypothetical protein